ncbi:efflux RND transporter permease subunit [Candidatus Laterigemmans baculatus]|uniref:efflux RND transporter permease subunit n=1 Tax=Candidatus Laterigemmans baculatus TaxID=2770505 RepID=UPI001F381479|nr:MMPL family transporter [Candidatus Laterigemmans baculatus]
MTSSFLSRRSIFGVPNALLILLVVFFLVPFGLRGARLSLEKTENNVKDWLPADFRETSELAWFGRYFAGEQFILATWEGATEEDQRLEILATKLQAESERGRGKHGEIPDFERAQALAVELGLLLPSDLHRNWGGLDEIWLTSDSGQWYYFTPAGQLFRWEGRSDTIGGISRVVRRLISGPQVEGTFITALGESGQEDDPDAINPYYNYPAWLTAPLFSNVQTGPHVADELSQPGGAFYPVDLTDAEFKPVVARRRAIKQLTGTLFASAVPEDFVWTPAAFREAVPEDRRGELPEDFDATVGETLERVIDERYEGYISALVAAPDEEQTEVWYEVFDAAGVAPPPRLTGILVTLTKIGQENLPFVVGRGVLGGPRGRLYQLAEQSGLSPPPSPVAAPPPFNYFVAELPPPGPEMHLGGPPIDNVSIDEEGTITLVRLVGYCAALGLLLSYISFRSLKITFMIFFVGGTAAVISLSIVWWSGASVDAILMSMPALVYVLGLSSAIHIVNYYREEVESEGVVGAPERALRHGWGPCTLASITTAIGLLSLYTSNIVPIRKFGWFSAVGVIATLVLLFAYLPAALETFSPAKDAPRKKKRPGKAAADSAQPGVGKLADYWEIFGRWVVAHHRWVAAGCLLMFIAAAFGVPKIRTSVHLLKMFDEDSRIIRDYTWLETNYAKLVPMELVLRVPPEMQQERVEAAEANGAEEPAGAVAAANAGAGADTDEASVHPLRRLERLEAVDHIQRTIARVFGDAGQEIVGQAMSAASLAPPLPPPSSSMSLERSEFNRRLGDSVDALIDSDYLRIEEDGPLAGSELWRISLRVGALSDVDYGRFINELRVAVGPVLEAYRYRGEVLDAVDAAKAEDPSIRFGDVIVLGRGKPRPVGAAPLLLPPPAGESEADVTAAEVIDTQTIFASTLSELLDNEPLRRTLWHEPNSQAFAGKQRTEAWGKLLAAASAVVLVDDSPNYDVDFIREHARQFVDARNIPSDRGVPQVVEGIPLVDDSGPLEVVYTGVIPVVYKAQRTLLTSLVESTIWAFVLIAAVMTILLNPGRPPLGILHPKALFFGIAAGMLAMLPNLFPVVMIFGSMGHAEWLVDIGTMMTASVAMGIAVDDTIHFLSWLRRGLDSGLSRHEAIIATYRRVGPAMTQTTFVGGLGLYVFALSTFTPTQRFGTLMLVLLTAALVGDLIFLPALLASPLGRVFRPRPHLAPTAKSPTPATEAADATETALPLPERELRESENGESPKRKTEPTAKASPASPKLLRPDVPHPSRRKS